MDANVVVSCRQPTPWKASSRLYFVRMLRRAGVDPKDIVTIYIALIRSIMEYGCQVWHTGLTACAAERATGAGAAGRTKGSVPRPVLQ